MTTPLVSVVLPVFNGDPGDVRRAIASLRAQTFDDWECVLVDDGSTPPVDRVADPRVRLIRLPQNLGRGAARQIGVDESRGDLIALQDGDDWSYPHRLERQVAFLADHPGVQVLGSPAALVEGRQIVAVAIPKGRPGHHPVLHPTLMLRRIVFDTARYDPSIRIAEDYDFLARVLPKHPSANLGEVLYAYRMAESAGLRKYWASQATRLRVGSRGVGVLSRTRLAASLGTKGVVYSAASLLGLRSRLVYRGRSAPSGDERQAFMAARATVEAFAEDWPESGHR